MHEKKHKDEVVSQPGQQYPQGLTQGRSQDLALGGAVAAPEGQGAGKVTPSCPPTCWAMGRGCSFSWQIS